MDYKSELLDNLKRGLQSIRCVGAIHQMDLFINRVDKFDRTTSRLKDKDGNELADLEAFLGAITVDDIEVRRMQLVNMRGGASYPGVKVIVKGPYIEIFESYYEDEYIRREYGIVGDNKKYFGFAMAYVGDNDTQLDLKVMYVDLYNKNDIDEVKEV